MREDMIESSTATSPVSQVQLHLWSLATDIYVSETGGRCKAGAHHECTSFPMEHCSPQNKKGFIVFNNINSNPPLIRISFTSACRPTMSLITVESHYNQPPGETCVSFKHTFYPSLTASRSPPLSVYSSGSPHLREWQSFFSYMQHGNCFTLPIKITDTGTFRLFSLSQIGYVFGKK